MPEQEGQSVEYLEKCEETLTDYENRLKESPAT